MAITEELLDRTKIAGMQHPEYLFMFRFWEKWRLCYEGGDIFVDRFLRKFSRREDNSDFLERKQLTPCATFSKAAINDIKNSIFQRMGDITREGGSPSYAAAIKGNEGGVDLLGNSMNSFMGKFILPELMTMKKVGIYVDMPPLSGPTLVHMKNKRPYLYHYKAEQIRNWVWDDDINRNVFKAVVLQDQIYDFDDDFYLLPSGFVNRYRHIFKDDDDGKVHVHIYNNEGYRIDLEGERQDSDFEYILDLDRVPFVVMELTHSLMADIASYQIALLNMESSDVAYAIKGNFPFYTEQFDPKTISPYLKDTPDSNYLVSTSHHNGTDEMKTGVAMGRRYPVGTERPAFINPDTAPLLASMQKQAQLKAEIRELVNLSVQSLQPRRESAESKMMDNQGLEAGLSYIGLELQHGERLVSEFWAEYENKSVPTINYPENYSIINEDERRDAAKDTQGLMSSVPSLTYQREMAKRVAHIMLGGRISTQTLRKIDAEIDKAAVVVGDPKIIASDIENGIVSLETASIARGYPPGEVEKAADDHADRLARIAESQIDVAQARGVSDLSGNPQGGRQEKKASRNKDQNSSTKSTVRGEGK